MESAQVIDIEPVPSIQSTAIAEYSPTAKALAELRQKYEGVVYDVSSSKGLSEAITARAEIRKIRVDLEKERRRIKAPALERCRLIDDEAKRITSALEALEDPIDSQIKAEQERKEREKTERIEADNRRRAEIHAKIDEIRSVTLSFQGKSSQEILVGSESFQQMDLDPDVYQEFLPFAVEARKAAHETLMALYQTTVTMEAEQARIKAEREELEKLRAAQAEQQAEIERLKAEQEAARKAEEARIAAERAAEEARLKAAREAEEAKLREERAAEEARQAEERAKLRAEQEAARKASEEEERRQAEERARIKAEQDRIAAEQKRLEEEKARQEEEARRLAIKKQLLEEQRCESPNEALKKIFNLADNVQAYPDHAVVRADIAIIAEANL